MSDVSKLNIHGTVYDLKDSQAREDLLDKADINQIPTKTSELTNDSGFITSSDIPSIPTKTSELTNDSGFITISSVPTKTSQLTNDSGFITSSDIPTIPTKTSELTNDSGFITISSVPTKTSQLTNDSNFAPTNDSYGTSTTESYSQNYINSLSATLGCIDLGGKDNSFDLNDLKAGETCYWSTGSANQPENAPCNGGRVYCFKGFGVGGQYPFQIAFYYDANTIYIRHKWANWSSWRTI